MGRPVSSLDFVYGKARRSVDLSSWPSYAINAMLVSSSYAPQPNTDQYVADIPAGAVAIRDVALTGLGITAAGVCFGTIPPFNAFLSALTVAALVLYINTGTDATSRLLYYSSSGIGFPFQPQGFNYVIAFDQANGGYFQA